MNPLLPPRTPLDVDEGPITPSVRRPDNYIEKASGFGDLLKQVWQNNLPRHRDDYTPLGRLHSTLSAAGGSTWDVLTGNTGFKAYDRGMDLMSILSAVTKGARAATLPLAPKAVRTIEEATKLRFNPSWYEAVELDQTDDLGRTVRDSVASMLLKGSEKKGVPPLKAEEIDSFFNDILQRVDQKVLENPDPKNIKSIRAAVLEIAEQEAIRFKKTAQDITQRKLTAKDVEGEEGTTLSAIDIEQGKKKVQEARSKEVEELYSTSNKTQQQLTDELKGRTTDAQRIGLRNPFLLQFQGLLDKAGLSHLEKPPRLPKNVKDTPGVKLTDEGMTVSIPTPKGEFVTRRSAHSLDPLLGRVPFARSSPVEKAMTTSTPSVISETVQKVGTMEELRQLQAKFIRRNPVAANNMLKEAAETTAKDLKVTVGEDVTRFVQSYIGGRGQGGNTLAQALQASGLEDKFSVVRMLLDRLSTKIATSPELFQTRAEQKLMAKEAIAAMRAKFAARKEAAKASRAKYKAKRRGE